MIEFVGGDGTTINKQIVTADLIRKMPLVAALLDVALRKGPEVAREITEKFELSGPQANHSPISGTFIF